MVDPGIYARKVERQPGGSNLEASENMNEGKTVHGGKVAGWTDAETDFNPGKGCVHWRN